MKNQRLTKDIYADMWNSWLVFSKSDTTTDPLQLKKQLGLLSENQDFTLRPSLLHPPSLQELFEAILNGIIRRKELGLYQHLLSFYTELQKALQEFIKIYTTRREIIIEIFQNVTKLSLTKETGPKIVIQCFNCSSYVYYSNCCRECSNVFYCDESCMKANKPEHVKGPLSCKEELQKTPNIFYPLILEIHSGSDMDENITVFYEHEMKMSLKMRGSRLLTYLIKFFIKHRWLKGNKYSLEESENSLKFIKHVEDKDQALLSPLFSRRSPVFGSASKSTTMKSLDSVQINTEAIERQVKNEKYAKLPIIQEVKMVFLNFGAVIQDVLQEDHKIYTRFVHVFCFPF